MVGKRKTARTGNSQTISSKDKLIWLFNLMMESQFMQESSLESDSISNAQMKYGERQIAEGQLITFPNPRIGRRYDLSLIHI